MFVKPNYCCNCGEKADRVDWRIWNSRRFCELCETEYLFDEWWPRAAIGIILVFGLTGIGFHYGSESKPVVAIESSNPRSNAVPVKINAKKPVQYPSPAKEGIRNPAAETAIGSKKDPKMVAPAEKKAAARPLVQKYPEEEVYFCGAMTKKGTACARRVKGGGRCWQHKDKESQ